MVSLNLSWPFAFFLLSHVTTTKEEEINEKFELMFGLFYKVELDYTVLS